MGGCCLDFPNSITSAVPYQGLSSYERHAIINVSRLLNISQVGNDPRSHLSIYLFSRFHVLDVVPILLLGCNIHDEMLPTNEFLLVSSSII